MPPALFPAFAPHHQQTVRPEPVEGPSFFSRLKKGRVGFDKLSPNGYFLALKATAISAVSRTIP